MGIRELAIGLLVISVAQGCAAPASAPTDITAATPRAAATIAQIGGSGVAGTVAFTPVAGGVRVDANVTGLKPGAEHGFHVHEVGDCGGAEGERAGGHFAPFGKQHGPPGSVDSHAGDLPNLMANAQGVATASYVAPRLSVGTGASAIVGRSVVVHRERDDYTSQPAGDSGARIACGVIRGGGA